jgi:hypothetical protein
VGEQGQLIEGGQEVEELGSGLLVFTEVVGVKVAEGLMKGME